MSYILDEESDIIYQISDIIYIYIYISYIMSHIIKYIGNSQETMLPGSSQRLPKAARGSQKLPEAPRRLRTDSQDTPRRHPGHSQDGPKRGQKPPRTDPERHFQPVQNVVSIILRPNRLVKWRRNLIFYRFTDF